MTMIQHRDCGDEQIDGAWRCECCGEMAGVHDTSFRWAGDRWQHRHPEAQTTFDCRYFGPKIGDESEAAMTDERAAEVERFKCPDCGVGVKVDEDGCCSHCGADCEIVEVIFELNALRAENERLKAENASLKEANEIDLGEKAPLIFENTELSARVSELTRLLAEAEEGILDMHRRYPKAALRNGSWSRAVRIALQSGEGGG